MLQAETKWTAAATQLEALTKTHDGVLGQLKEAQERSELAEQETIEVSGCSHVTEAQQAQLGSGCCVITAATSQHVLHIFLFGVFLQLHISPVFLVPYHAHR